MGGVHRHPVGLKTITTHNTKDNKGVVQHTHLKASLTTALPQKAVSEKSTSQTGQRTSLQLALVITP